MSNLDSGDSSPRNSVFTNGGASSTTASSLLLPPPDGLRDAAKRVVDAYNPDVDVHQLLRGVRLDEIVTLSRSTKAAHTVKQDSSFPASFYIPLVRYLKYIYDTWSNIAVITLQHDLPFFDWALTVVFAAITTTILFFVLIWCQFANNPFIKNAYLRWANKNVHGLGLVNASDPHLFNSLTQDQAKAAKTKLGLSIEESVSTQDLRVFDLDIGKFLLQLASIVYERAPVALHETLEDMTAAHRASSPSASRKHTSAATQDARKCTVHRPADATPNSPPHTPSPNASALHTPGGSGSGMHTPNGIHVTGSESIPGRLVRDIWGDEQADKIEKAFDIANTGHGRNVIEDFVKRMDIDYEPVSELNNSSSAYCSFFWDNNSNWIVVTFKGTGPTEYADWVTDLTVTLGDVTDFLPGYSKAILGFKERLYPSNVSELGGTRPWDSIRYSLCKLSEQLSYNLSQNGQSPKINVWFTGHSLGCALATLAYTRAISTPSDFAGYPIEIRDAYLFAAPVSADRATAIKFNETLANFDAINANTIGKTPPVDPARNHARTMWRIRNAGDAVATLLPQLGDRADLVGKITPTNPAAFAHLGAEIHMRNSPHASQVISPTSHFGGIPSDYAASPPIRVEIRSEFSKGEIEAQRKLKFSKRMGEREREAFFVWSEKIPLIGRFLAHDTVFYWDQLDRIAVSGLKWVNQ